MVAKRVTLKDIAGHCGVSTALVSAVLNQRVSNMNCSDSKRKLIFSTAEKLGYHANVFASAIRRKSVPIVGVFLFLRTSGDNILDASINIALARLTALLNKEHLEVLFVPYTDAKVELERIKALCCSGLLGGLIFNIRGQNDTSVELCNYVKSTGLPAIAIGKSPLPDFYCVYSASAERRSKVLEAAAAENCERCFVVEPDDKDVVKFREYPFPDDFLWEAPVIRLADMDRSLFENSFFEIMGLRLLFFMREKNIVPKHRVLVEFAHMAPFVPKDEKVTYSGVRLDWAEYAAPALSRWMLTGQKPDHFIVKC